MAIGFATISPIVGLYAVVLIGMSVAGPASVWVLPVALVGQCLLLSVFSELAAEFPIAGGPYQWSRRLVGGAYAWFSGWVAICAYAVANTTIAYLGAPWALTVLGIEPTAGAIVVTGMLILVCALAARAASRSSSGSCARAWLRRRRRSSVSASSCCSSSGSRTSRLRRHARRRGRVGRFGNGRAARSARGRGLGLRRLRRLRRQCGGDTRRRPARAARLVDGGPQRGCARVPELDPYDAGHPGARGRRERTRPGAVTTAVVASFGSWSTRPFTALVLVAFVACGMAAQALTARTMFSIARDGVLPGSSFLRRIDRRGSPVGAVLMTGVAAAAGLLLGLESTAIRILIVFGTAAIYVAFLLVASRRSRRACAARGRPLRTFSSAARASWRTSSRWCGSRSRR